ncbi:MAG: thiamine pyrophosphate-dependent enzyme [Pseudomonadota bacterium]
MTDNYLDRRAFTGAVLAGRGDALVLPGLGAPTWDCAAAGLTGEALHSWGGMGLSLATALGVAIAQPSRRVLCLTGDGEMMMGLGMLAVVGAEAPANLGILVVDNEHFGETGEQPGLAPTTDLCQIAQGAGIRHSIQVTAMEQVPDLIELLFHRPGPCFALAKIALGDYPLVMPEKHGPSIASAFRTEAMRTL